MKSLLLVLLAVLACTGCGAAGSARARPLFEAMPLPEWRVVGAAAEFTLAAEEDGGGGATLVGRGPIPRNGFLTSPRELGDFRLSVEVRLGSAELPLGEGMNSGIQIRSAERDGTIAGLQIEVDPTERLWSGGVYDERGRGWLAPLKDDPAAMAAFRRGEWNLYEIECIGPRIRTRVNGVACAEWFDGAVSGLIAFQVHGGKACEVAFRAPVLEELGAHAWMAEAPEAQRGAQERDDASRAVPSDALGVRFERLAGNATVELLADDGSSLALVEIDAGAPSMVEFVWLDGRGAALVNGARVASLSLAKPVSRVTVRGEGVSVGGHAVLRRAPHGAWNGCG